MSGRGAGRISGPSGRPTAPSPREARGSAAGLARIGNRGLAQLARAGTLSRQLAGSQTAAEPVPIGPAITYPGLPRRSAETLVILQRGDATRMGESRFTTQNAFERIASSLALRPNIISPASVEDAARALGTRARRGQHFSTIVLVGHGFPDRFGMLVRHDARPMPDVGAARTFNLRAVGIDNTPHRALLLAMARLMRGGPGRLALFACSSGSSQAGWSATSLPAVAGALVAAGLPSASVLGFDRPARVSITADGRVGVDRTFDLEGRATARQAPQLVRLH